MSAPAFIPSAARLSQPRTRSVCAPRRRARTVVPRCSAARATAAAEGDDTAAAAAANANVPGAPPPGGGDAGSRWRTAADCDVLLPASGAPQSVLLFIGGLGPGVSAPSFYTNLLSRLADLTGAAVVAARLPVLPPLDHDALARDTRAALAAALAVSPALARLPRVALGHSLGARLHVLSASTSPEDGAGDGDGDGALAGVALLAFSNAPAPRELLPVLERVPDVVDAAADGVRGVVAALGGLLDGAGADAAARGGAAARAVVRGAADAVRRGVAGGVTPDPAGGLARARGVAAPVLVVRFSRDSLDDGVALADALRMRTGAGAGLVVRELSGTHVTPAAPALADREFGDGLGGAGEEMRRRARAAARDADAEMARLVETVAAFVGAVAA